jgi:hypothetical protein
MLASFHYARALLFVFITLLFGRAASAASIEKLIMPGPVSQAHAKIETECSQCHDLSSRERQSALCLACHKEIAGDFHSKSGYHGRMRQAAVSQCRGCHTEHLGRDADITRLSQAGFSHDLTNFPLQDAHLTLTCPSCHKPGVSFREAPSTCAGCHGGKDPHRGALGAGGPTGQADCAACHDAKSWHNARFDHSATSFPLTNKHLETSCAACHPGARYKGTPVECVGCHAPDDVHKGSQGKECGNCHTTADWATQKFDHARETGFALLGRHAHIGCADCHRTGDLHAPIAKDCAGCHKGDDRHESRLGPSCADCHGNDLWRVVAYNHPKFKLTGAHAKVDCHDCHTATVQEQKLGTECVGCHRASSPHGPSMEHACEQCHSTTTWSDVTFDHDLTTYPLLGLHVAATCAQCHTTQHFKETSRDCNSCHARDDVHNGALSKACAQCHTPNGWKLWDFDHAARTRFPLSGAHAKVGCSECHLKPQSDLKPSMLCGACHAENDVHAGRFGQQCQQCHTTGSFKRPRTNN